MSNEQDMLVWKLDRELSKARLALGRIYTIASKVYCPEAKHAMSSIHRDDVDKIMETLEEFFKDGKINNTK